jgi:hypothetical protein
MRRRSFLKFVGLTLIAPLSLIPDTPIPVIKPRMLKATWTKELDNDLKRIYGFEPWYAPAGYDRGENIRGNLSSESKEIG